MRYPEKRERLERSLSALDSWLRGFDGAVPYKAVPTARPWSPLEAAFYEILRRLLASEADSLAANVLATGAAGAVNDATWWHYHQAQMLDELAHQMSLVARFGAQAGREALSTSVSVNWGLVNRNAVDWATHHAGELVTEIEPATRQAITQAVSEWSASGQPLSTLADKLRQLSSADAGGPFSPARAQRIAQTESTNAFAHGNTLAWEAAGVERAAFTPAAHVNCILPGNEVVAPGHILAAAKSFYQGRCVEIVLESGRSLTVTKNHPVLTPRGWVAAKFLCQGDDVLCTINGERVASAINPDNDHRPALIEDVFGALEVSDKMIASRMPVAAVDFHGDGREVHGDIKIVNVKRLLELYRIPAFDEPFSQEFLALNGVPLTQLISHSALDIFGMSVGAATRSRVSIGEHGSAVGGRGISPTSVHGFGEAARLDASGQQALAEGHALDTGLASEFLFRFASDVAADKIIKVRDFDFSGHVYDLQVSPYALYTCNSVIVHNCRCYLQPFRMPSGAMVMVWYTANDERVCTQPIQTPWGEVAGCRALHDTIVSAGQWMGTPKP